MDQVVRLRAIYARALAVGDLGLMREVGVALARLGAAVDVVPAPTEVVETAVAPVEAAVVRRGPGRPPKPR